MITFLVNYTQKGKIWLSVGLFLFLITSCQNTPASSTKKTSSSNMQDIKSLDWQGHRGCRGILPENTIPAFIKALDYPIQTLELDVVASKDSTLIVSHEPWMSAEITTKPDGTIVTEEEEKELNLFKMTYEKIKTFDVGSRGNERFPQQQKMKTYKPSLLEMVTQVEAYCKQNNLVRPYYNIEIKSQPEWDNIYTPVPAEFAKLLVEELSILGIKGRTTIQSFDVRSLQATQIIDKTVTLALLVENLLGVEENLARLGFIPEIYSPYHMLINEAVIDTVHQNNMLLIPWTVNEPEVMKKLIAIGVDGIITDYPNRIEEAMK